MNPLAVNWWAITLRGVVALLFGLVTFAWPGFTLAYLIALFGIFAFFDGVLNLIAAFHAPAGHHRWIGLLFVGLAGIAAGILTFAYPGVTALTLLYFIAAWAVLGGIFQIVAALRLRRHVRGEWILILSGSISLLFGLALFVSPEAAALALVTLFGGFAIASGILLIFLGLRLRSHVRQAIGVPGSSGQVRHA